MPKNRSGFSLIEMLMVVVIAGIVIGVSASKYGTITAHQRVVRGANALSSTMRFAFSMAERKRQPVRLVFSKDKMALLVMTRTYSKVFNRVDLGNQNEVHADGIGLLKSQVSVYPSTNYVDVFPSGFASDSMVITIKSGTGTTDITRKVRMSRAGMVIVQ